MKPTRTHFAAMKRTTANFLSVLIGFLLVGNSLAAGINFNRDIRPILSDRCFHCHGPAEEDREANLRLDQRDGEEGALRTLDGVTAIEPGDPDASELWHRITSDDEYERMPPEDSNKPALSQEEQQLLKQWITDGAKYDDFWSFVPLESSSPPRVQNESWQHGFIDPHVMARLEAEGLRPKHEADKRTLIRRVALDLTGLPPTLPEINEFLADDSPIAYENLVDRLLAKAEYGEHMARYWADLVRLADTNGMHKDFYRNFLPVSFDWLIRAFNDNLEIR